MNEKPVLKRQTVFNFRRGRLDEMQRFAISLRYIERDTVKARDMSLRKTKEWVKTVPSFGFPPSNPSCVPFYGEG